MIRFESTRGGAAEKTAAQAIIQGIAEDKGLFVPDRIPELPETISAYKCKTYKEVATSIIGAFFDDFTDEELKYCIDGAYTDKFTSPDVVPVVEAGGAHFLELYHGRTAAFKDLALSILPYLLTTATKKENEEKKICILTATSGDTGKAALEGFADVPGTEIVVFFPNHGVSAVQERQMVTQTGDNTHVFAIEGNFDDAQTAVKRIFNDKDFAEKLEGYGCRFSSANSINIGRLVPQVAYYVWGYGKLLEKGTISVDESERAKKYTPLVTREEASTEETRKFLAHVFRGKASLLVNHLVDAGDLSADDLQEILDVIQRKNGKETERKR